jgi:hypothetical protein
LFPTHLYGRLSTRLGYIRLIALHSWSFESLDAQEYSCKALFSMEFRIRELYTASIHLLQNTSSISIASFTCIDRFQPTPYINDSPQVIRYERYSTTLPIKQQRTYSSTMGGSEGQDMVSVSCAKSDAQGARIRDEQDIWLSDNVRPRRSIWGHETLTFCPVRRCAKTGPPNGGLGNLSRKRSMRRSFKSNPSTTSSDQYTSGEGK